MLFFSLLRGLKQSKQRQQGGKNTSCQHFSTKKSCSYWQGKAMALQHCWIWIWLYSSLLYKVKNNKKYTVFVTQLLRFLLLPQTSLSRLIKQHGLPGYCLCIWLTGLCRPFNLRSKTRWPHRCWQTSHGFIIWCSAVLTSAGLRSGLRFG